MTLKPTAAARALDAFASATRTWFGSAFPSGPTPVQERTWAVIGRGENALVIAPTGSGKTLAAFLSAIDRLIQDAAPGHDATGPARARRRGVRVLYISPLKALGADVERNLRRPLSGITAAGLGASAAPITVGVRSGDTPAAERRRLRTRPPDILITTPESLYLMLTSAVRETLRGVQTVIVDEIHSFAASKRGTHLALSLERLDDLLERPAQRIGLSATVAPREEIARFLGGGRPVSVIAADSSTTPEVSVIAPVADMARVSATADRRTRMERAGRTGRAGRAAALGPGRGGRPGRGDGRGAWRSDRSLRRALADTAGAGDPAPGDVGVGDASRGSDPGDAAGADGTDGAAGSGPADRAGGPGSPLSAARIGRTGDGARRTASIWPHIEEAVLDQAVAHRTTLVFVNSRGACERLTAHLNEAWALRAGAGSTAPDAGSGSAAGSGPEPARVRESWEMGETAYALPLPGSAPVIAKAHHGSVSKEQRLAIERELKSGRLRCVVATASLELGIDMGAIDLVLQIAPPPSVASGMQRVGRADHRVGGRPHGIIYPVERTQLIDAAVTAEGMRAGDIERTVLVTNALDVLAQQTVAAAVVEDLDPDAWYATVRRAAPYAGLPRPAFDSVLEMLTGAYACADLSDFAPRLVRDPGTGALTARSGAQRLAVTASGTIPDRGMFPVVLPEGARDGGRRRIGELDEEMVNETAVGDIVTLGTTGWRVREIGADRVVVDPAPGRSSRLPFWRGDGPGRPAATGAARGAFLREAAAGLPDGPGPDGAPDGGARASRTVTGGPAAASDEAVDGAGPETADPAETAGRAASADVGARPALLDRLAAAGLDDAARSNLIALLHEQRAVTGVVPSDTALVLERYKDEGGSWRIILHSPYGRRVHEPWAMAIRERVRRLLGLAPQVVVADDGIVLQVPAVREEAVGGAGSRGPFGAAGPLGAELVVFDAEELTRFVRSRIDGTALFAARFRECAARSLLMPAAVPGRRTPLWLQRIKSGQLLEAARRFPDFPVLVEAARECLQDVYDLPALARLMERIAAGRVRIIDVTTPAPSPFAHPLLFGYTGALLYQEDLPHAERRARLLSLDPDAVAALIGDDGVADLLDEEVLARVDAELQRLAPERRARPDAEGIADLLRELGPLTLGGLAARCRVGASAGGGGDAEAVGAPAAAAVRDALAELERARRALPVRIGGREYWARAEDAPLLRAALGVDVPHWVRQRESAARRPVGRGPLDDLVLRHARTRAGVSARSVADAFGLEPDAAGEALARLGADGALVRLGGADTGDGAGGGRVDGRWMAPDVLRRVRSRSLARARRATRPVSPHALQRLVLARAGVAEPRGGIDALADAVASLEGAWLPAAAWETTVLPARVADYRPAMLDELVAAGDIIWQARSRTPREGSDRGEGARSRSTTPEERSGGERAAPDPGTAPASASSRAAEPPAEIALHPSDSPLAPGMGEPLSADAQHAAEVWSLAGRGLATASSFGPVRRALSPSPAGPPRRRVRSRRGRGRYTGLLGSRAPAAGSGPTGSGPAALVVGPAWHRLQEARVDDARAALASVESLLDRYGVITPDFALAAGLPGGIGPLMPLLRRMEDTGALLRGGFVEGLGPLQFAERETVEALRSFDGRDGAGDGADGAGARADSAGRAVVVDLTDPACLVGRGVPWPAPALPPDFRAGDVSRTPMRRQGTGVVLLDGRPVLYAGQNLRALVSYTDERDELETALEVLVVAQRRAAEQEAAGAGPRRVETLNGIPAVDRTVAELLGGAGLVREPKGMRLVIDPYGRR